MQSRVRHLIDRLDEKGVSLPLVGLALLTLFWFAALGTDLGWFYVNAQRVQRAADAAALGGVIYLPGDLAAAESTANDIGLRNGYADQAGDSTSGTYPQIEIAQIEDTQLEVSVYDEVPSFFLKIFGLDTFVVSRKATAEYVPPLKLGSPSNKFGNECDPEQAGCAGQDNFWANIHGKYTNTTMGDAYSSYCDGSSGNSSCSTNGSFRSRGYLYGIERGSNSGFTIEFLDMAHHNRSGGVVTNDNLRTGDRGCEDWGTSSSSCGQTVTANLYAPSPSPFELNPSDLLCSYTWAPEPQVNASAPYVFESPAACFSQASASAGIYRLQIVVEEPSQARYSGLNRYSLRVSSGSQLYALGDFSIYSNTNGGLTEFYLAEVSDTYQGKTFVIELYDPGESNQNGYLKVIDPRTGLAFADAGGQCRVYHRNRNTSTWTYAGTASPCQELVTPSEYQGRWLKFEIDIPDTYSCGANCWWKMQYDYSAGSIPTDTTTWRSYIEGNPIHLIRNN